MENDGDRIGLKTLAHASVLRASLIMGIPGQSAENRSIIGSVTPFIIRAAMTKRLWTSRPQTLSVSWFIRVPAMLEIPLPMKFEISLWYLWFKPQQYTRMGGQPV